MQSFPEGFQALVIGSTGALGGALVQCLRAEPHCGAVTGLSRNSTPAIDFDDEQSIARAADALQPRGPFHLIFIATGLLHTPRFMPEKRLAQLGYTQMAETFRINAFGPALALAHFAPLLATPRSVLAALSAKVGSIEDNRLGGWYSYRASKAALNMFVKTTAIELRRTAPNAVLVALHPGTVDSSLSAPFRGAQIGRPPLTAAADLLRVVDGLGPQDSGAFRSYGGDPIAW